MNIFSMDSTFYKVGEKVFDLIFINFIFLITSILGLGITLGASLTAMFYTVNKTMRKGEGTLLKNYFKSFKENFKQATLIWIILSIGYFTVWLNIENMNFYGGISMVIVPLTYFLLAELVIVTIFIFPLLAKVNLTTKELFKKSLLLGHKHLLTSITSVSVVITMGFLVLKVHPVFIIVAFTLPGYLISRLVYENIIVRYIPKAELEKVGERYERV